MVSDQSSGELAMRLSLKILLALATSMVSFASAQQRFQVDEDIRPRPFGPQRSVNTRVEISLQVGIAKLLETQNEDGSWNGNTGAFYGGSYRVHQADVPHVGVTAIAGLALLETRSFHDVQDALDRCASYLMSVQNEFSYIIANQSRLHDHAYATEFLVRYSALRESDDARRSARRAVELLVTAQRKDGGWGWVLFDPNTKVMATVCILQSLIEARKQGFQVRGKAIEKAQARLRTCALFADNDPKKAKTLSQEMERMVPAYSAGAKRDDLWRPVSHQPNPMINSVSAGLSALAGQVAPQNMNRPFADHVLKLQVHESGPRDYYYYHAHFYTSDAARALGKEHWDTYWDRCGKYLAKGEFGSWRAHDIGENYGTAMSLRVLASAAAMKK